MNNLKKIKYLCALLLWCGLTVLLAGAEKIRAEIVPGNLTVGDPAYLRLSVPLDGNGLQMPALPQVDGIRWNNRIEQRQDLQIINGRQTGNLTLSIGFTPLKEGTFTIPSVRIGNLETNSVTFSVNKALVIENESDAVNQLAFATLNFTGKKRAVYYVGEEIPLTFSVMIRAPYGGQAGELQFLFTPENSAKLLEETYTYPAVRRNIGGQPFTVSKFGKTVRLTAPGSLSIHAALLLSIVEDDMFFPRVAARKNLSAMLENITVKERPPLPADALFSGLTGYGWNVVYDLSPPPYRSGEAVTLKLDLSGYGNTALFHWDGLKTNQQFRAYPPEIKREKEIVTVRQTLLPLQTGELDLNTSLLVFDTDKGEYVSFPLKRTVSVEQGTAEQIAPPPETKDDTAKSKTTSDTESYAGLAEADEFAETDSTLISVLLISAGLIVLAVCSFVKLNRKNCNPEKQHRKNILAGKGKLLRLLDKSFTENGLDAGSASALAEYLCAALDLPSGTSLAEAAKFVRDPELASVISGLAENLWSPAGTGKKFDPACKRNLLKGLRYLPVLLLLLFVLPCAGAGENAFYSGDFDTALEKYQAQPKTAGTLYNMGCCYTMKGDYPRALAEYEQAIRLAPRNGKILHNLNLTRRKLGLEERTVPEDTAGFFRWLRDMIRADEWLIAGAAGLMLCLAGTGLGMLYGRKILTGMYAAGVLLILLCGTAVLTKPEDRTAVVVSAAAVYSLPSEQAGKTEGELSPGTEVVTEEQHRDWCRIRFGASGTGWIRESSIRQYGKQ